MKAFAQKHTKYNAARAIATLKNLKAVYVWQNGDTKCVATAILLTVRYSDANVNISSSFTRPRVIKFALLFGTIRASDDISNRYIAR
jgi:hypothetical protein